MSAVQFAVESLDKVTAAVEAVCDKVTCAVCDLQDALLELADRLETVEQYIDDEGEDDESEDDEGEDDESEDDESEDDEGEDDDEGDDESDDDDDEGDDESDDDESPSIFWLGDYRSGFAAGFNNWSSDDDALSQEDHDANMEVGGAYAVGYRDGLNFAAYVG